MSVGQRSLLFGVHQFIWHPITVNIAWCRLYGFPNLKELMCIIIHDWGYWYCTNMDGNEGQRHPEIAAKLAGNWWGQKYHDLCLYHSRHYSKNVGVQPSPLCWADKLSILFEPWWFYLPRAWLSGELKEYRQKAADEGIVPISAGNREWFEWMKNYLSKQGQEQCSCVRVKYASKDATFELRVISK